MLDRPRYGTDEVLSLAPLGAAPQPTAGTLSDLRSLACIRLNSGYAEAEVAVAVARRKPVASRRPDIMHAEAPVAAAIHAVRERANFIFIPPTTPHPNITIHVVKISVVSLLLTHRMSSVARLLTAPSVITHLTFIVAETPSRLATRAAGIFPISLCR